MTRKKERNLYLDLQTRQGNAAPSVCPCLREVVFLRLKTTVGEKFQLVWVARQLVDLFAQQCERRELFHVSKPQDVYHNCSGCSSKNHPTVAVARWSQSCQPFLHPFTSSILIREPGSYDNQFKGEYKEQTCSQVRKTEINLQMDATLTSPEWGAGSLSTK